MVNTMIKNSDIQFDLFSRIIPRFQSCLVFWKAESLLFHLEAMFLVDLQVLASENGGERTTLSQFHENIGFS